MRCQFRRILTFASIVGSCFIAACTSAETSVTSPTVDKCAVSATGNPSSSTATGGQGTLAVATARDCTWSIANSLNWVSIATMEGQGEASITYSVAPNPVPNGRSGAISVGGQTVQLSQAAAPCR